jgi:hypothetical protein
MSKPYLSFALFGLLLCGTSSASSTAGYSGGLDTTLKVLNTGTGTALTATATGSGSTGLYATGPVSGIRSESQDGIGVDAFSTDNYGVQAASDDNYGLWASSNYSAAIGAQGYSYGLYANASAGYGVWASGDVGVSGYSSSSHGVGVSGIAVAWSGNNKGVNAYAYGGDAAYGLYSAAAGATQNWAGYFSGNVHVTGSLSWVSDARFKTNVRPLTQGLEKVMALRPKTYEMKAEEFKDRIHLAEGGQYGLIAEEVEAVLPDLVMPVSAPPESAADVSRKAGGESATLSYKSVNYTALIPILVTAVQEQQKLIQAQQARIEALEAKGGR